MPVASVIIPAFDAADVIGEQLGALSEQDPDVSWEVIVADNGSSDGTPEVAARWADRLPRLRVVDASGTPTSGHARNVGAAAADGDLLVFCDADDVVAPTWLRAHVEGLEQHHFTTGPLELERLNDAATAALGAGLARSTPLRANAFLPYAVGANLGVRRAVFDEVGGFDATRAHGNDKVFSWSVILAGYPLEPVPDAVVHYRMRRTAAGTFRRQFRIGRHAPSLYARFRAHGMPRSSLRLAVRDWLRVLAFPLAMTSRDRRLAYLRLAGRQLGRLVGSIEERVLYL